MQLDQVVYAAFPLRPRFFARRLPALGFRQRPIGEALLEGLHEVRDPCSLGHLGRDDFLAFAMATGTAAR